MPCALGGVIDGEVAAQAPWGAVCGSANNQLAGADVGEVLHARGIPWAPDVVVNAGAVIEGVLTVRGGQGEDVRSSVAAAIEGIGATCESVLREAAQRGISPGHVTRDRIRTLSR
jgi:leucine dehydrogenase